MALGLIFIVAGIILISNSEFLTTKKKESDRYVFGQKAEKFYYSKKGTEIVGSTLVVIGILVFISKFLS